MKKFKISTPTNKDNKGVFAISLVDHPAMESEWVALKEQPIQLKTLNDKEQTLLGVALIPDKPIYRNDENNGEHLIEFSKQAIRETAYKFLKLGNQNNATENHKIQLDKQSVNVVESWIIEDDEKDKTRLHGINEPVGSWVLKLKVNDKELYNKAENGELKGFSIEGLFDKQLINLNKNEMSQRSISEEIKEGFAKAMELLKQKKEVQLGEVTLKDGETTISFEGDELEAGLSATVNGDPIPVGEHELQSGQVVVVEEEGTISEVKQAEGDNEGGDVDAEKEETKKAIVEAIMNLKKEDSENEKQLIERLEKAEKRNEELETKLSKINESLEKLSETPNKSRKKETQVVDTSQLTREGRLLQSIRN